MNTELSIRRQSCTAIVVVIVLQQLLVLPTSAVVQHHMLLDVDIDHCIVLCAREHLAFTTISVQESQQELQRSIWKQRKQQQQISQCTCNNNNESRTLEQQHEPLTRRIEVDTGRTEPTDGETPTAAPTVDSTGDDTGDSGSGMDDQPTITPQTTMAPIPSPSPEISAPIIEGNPQVPITTVSPHPSAIPTIQSPQLPTPNFTPTTDTKPPSSSEAPSDSQRPTISMMPTRTNTVSEAPMRPMETESPIVAKTNDDYDGERNYDAPSTDVITPETTNTESNASDSNLSGGGKFGIVLLVGIVLGVIGVGYMTMQSRLRRSYRGNYSSTYGMSNNNAETELGLWESNARNRRDDDDGLL